MKKFFALVLCLALGTASVALSQDSPPKQNQNDVSPLTSLVAISVVINNVTSSSIVTTTFRARTATGECQILIRVANTDEVPTHSRRLCELSSSQLEALEKAYQALRIDQIANIDIHALPDFDDSKPNTVILLRSENKVFGFYKTISDLGDDEQRVKKFLDSISSITSELISKSI